MRIINIVDSVDNINYGVWHAAIVNATLLSGDGIETELWYPEKAFKCPIGVTGIGLPLLTIKELKNIVIKRNLDPSKDIIVTHGAWKYPTRWGAWLKRKGFRWVYVPQGMLEPWSMKQKWLKKQVYFNLIEKKLATKADAIRAVSFPESENLKALMKHSIIKFIPNGVLVEERETAINRERITRRSYLFLSRLHHKKNVVTLAEAWLKSRLNNDEFCELLIAGPDQGELEKLMPLVKRSRNIRYIGSVYDENKKEVLEKCTFYVLPSFSEGLPSSLLEAMSYGLIPVISEGCNLPEVFTQNLGIKVGTNVESIRSVLDETVTWKAQTITDIGLKSRQFIKRNYSIESITDLQMMLFKELGNGKNDLL
jgi:glycosyltransferase involved in cell wall biosynthesis